MDIVQDMSYPIGRGCFLIFVAKLASESTWVLAGDGQRWMKKQRMIEDQRKLRGAVERANVLY
jgi:hypothetical protein